MDVCTFLDLHFRLDYVRDGDAADVKAEIQVEAIGQAEKMCIPVTTTTTTDQQ